MNTIGEKTVSRITADMQEMLETHMDEISRAFDEEANLSISMSAKLEDSGGGNVKITTKISFTTGKISDSYESSVNERQEELPFPTIPEN